MCVVLDYLRGLIYCPFFMDVAEWLLVTPDDLATDPYHPVEGVPVDGTCHTKP